MKSKSTKYQPLVSIIVPVYNVQEYLTECLDSIVGQTYKNLEIICVNDGTPDRSEDIIDRFIAQDKRVQKVNQENMGLNMARLSGFKKSTGEYILFVDSDDAIHEDAVRIALNNALRTNSEISVFGYKTFSRSSSEAKDVIENRVKVIDSEERVLRYLMVNDPEYTRKTLLIAVWGKLYRRSLIEGFDWKLSNYRQHEDLFWTPLIFSRVSGVICINGSSLYYYRKDPKRRVLSAAFTGNTFNGRPVSHMELAQRYRETLSQILDNKHLKTKLYGEFEHAAYAMYVDRMDDLVDGAALDVEGNTLLIPEYHLWSKKRVQTLENVLLSQGNKIKELAESNRNLLSKLDPDTAYIKATVRLLLAIIKHRIQRLLSGVRGR